MPLSRVALIRGQDRYDNVARALQAIDDQIDLAGKQRIVVKPNFVTTQRELAATHVDAVRAVLDHLRRRGVTQQITLAEGPAIGSAQEGFRNYGYEPLIREYGLRVVDINQDETEPVQVWNTRLRPHTVRVSRTVLESDFRISIGPPKTHDTVIVTLSLKNYVVGSLVGKRAVHQGCAGINLNLYKLAYHVAPHLSVIDGFVGMEGHGPTRGEPVDWRIAVASTDFLAADCLTARLMGFDPHEVGYLHYCLVKGLGHGEPEEIEVVGNVSLEGAYHSFRPHPTTEEQKSWRVEGVERYL
jgi:uncharacterized protein (DUF362 family)